MNMKCTWIFPHGMRHGTQFFCHRMRKMIPRIFERLENDNESCVRRRFNGKMSCSNHRLTTAKCLSNIRNDESDKNNSVTVSMYRVSAMELPFRSGCCYVLLHNLCKKMFYNLYENRNENKTCTVLMFAWTGLSATQIDEIVIRFWFLGQMEMGKEYWITS